jgi:endonuclease/exonuclease/phosphatase family metal-dependent hydrolase
MLISIATFNAGLIQLKIGGRVLFEFAPYVDDRAEALPDLLLSLDVDLICLQEVFTEKHWKAVVSRLSSKFPFAHRANARRPQLFDLGLGLLSRYPIANAREYLFTAQLADEWLVAPRGMQVATIELPYQKSIVVANCHTTAGGIFSHPESKKANFCRASQLQQLVTSSAELSGFATFVVGDLNCGPEASPANYESLLQAAGYRDLVAEWFNQAGVDCPPVTWDPANSLNAASPHKNSPPQRIDHILCREKSCSSLTPKDVALFGTDPTVHVASGQKVTISDHYGFLATFNLGRYAR